MLPKSSGKGLLGGKSASGNVTVVDARFYRSSARNAKVAFYLTAIIVGLLAAVIAADWMHPILALFYGALIGIGLGAIVWAVVRIWPVLRLIWWWLTEIVTAFGLIYGWTVLAGATSTLVMAVVVAILVGVPAAYGPVRRRIVALAWCVIVRHRLRTCFAQFITANRSGSLPLIGIAYPTPVGERVSITLRPGLSLSDLQTRLDKLAVGCRAAAVTVEQASSTNAARIRIDIKRRDVLTATVDSPLVDHVDDQGDELDPSTVVGAPTLALVPTALDLPDVTKPATPPASKPSPASRDTGNGRKPASRPTNNGASSGATDGDDLADWI
jgi:hypothetical protein